MISYEAYRIVARLKVQMSCGTILETEVSGTNEIKIGNPINIIQPPSKIEYPGIIIEILEVSIRNLH